MASSKSQGATPTKSSIFPTTVARTASDGAEIRVVLPPDDPLNLTFDPMSDADFKVLERLAQTLRAARIRSKP
jgi:hypothetical protein